MSLRPASGYTHYVGSLGSRLGSSDAALGRGVYFRRAVVPFRARKERKKEGEKELWPR